MLLPDPCSWCLQASTSAGGSSASASAQAASSVSANTFGILQQVAVLPGADLCCLGQALANELLALSADNSPQVGALQPRKPVLEGHCCPRQRLKSAGDQADNLAVKASCMPGCALKSKTLPLCATSRGLLFIYTPCVSGGPLSESGAQAVSVGWLLQTQLPWDQWCWVRQQLLSTDSDCALAVQFLPTAAAITSIIFGLDPSLNQLAVCFVTTLASGLKDSCSPLVAVFACEYCTGLLSLRQQGITPVCAASCVFCWRCSLLLSMVFVCCNKSTQQVVHVRQ